MLKKSLQILFCISLLTCAESFAQKKDKKNKNAPQPAAAEAKSQMLKKNPNHIKRLLILLL